MSIDLLPLNLCPALVSSSDKGCPNGSATPISISDPIRDRSDRQEQVEESYLNLRYLTKLDCCDGSERKPVQMIPILLNERRVHSISSILDKFDEHFRVYSWYRGLLTFGKSGFGFQLSDRHGADKILKAIHFINGKQVSIRRILFVGGLPENTRADYLKEFFSKYGKVEEHEIARKYKSGGQAADFGFILYNSAETVDDLVAAGKIDFCGVEVLLDKARLLRVYDASRSPGQHDKSSHPYGIEFDDYPKKICDFCGLRHSFHEPLAVGMHEWGPWKAFRKDLGLCFETLEDKILRYRPRGGQKLPEM